jgi:hypothetical protein
MLRVAMKPEKPALVTAIACRMKFPAIGGGRIAGPKRHGGWRRSFVGAGGCDTFRRILAHLRGACPAAQPVVVRTSWLPAGTLGECVRRPRKFVIRLSDELDEQLAIEVLCHEWAHALAWNFTLDRLSKMPGMTEEDFQAASHDEAWGCAYSRVWRAYLDVTQEAEG